MGHAAAGGARHGAARHQRPRRGQLQLRGGVGGGLVVAGTHQLRDESYLLFWDTRQGGQLQGGYWDSHCDDITSASFQADTATLATGCTDGLVNILDLRQQDEDEALVTSLNTQDSVARVTWYQDSREDLTLTLTV